MERDPAPPIPDLCTPGSVLLLVLIGLAVAVFYTLSAISGVDGFWLTFGLAVLFVEWVVLLSAATLCVLRSRVEIWSPSAVGWLVIVIVSAITVIASLIVVAFSDVPGRSTEWFVFRNTLISLLASLALVRYLVLQQRWKQQVAAESRARLDALQASIRPHFLFNALNTIASLVHDKPDEAEQATLDLSDLLRSGFRSGATHSLAEEIELSAGYLRIEALRLGDRLEVDWDVDERLPLERQVPALLLQPLVENAIVHGIARRVEGGCVTVRCEMAGWGRVRFVITNPLSDSPGKPPESNGTALDNIRQRLALAYEEGARLTTRRENGRFRVELTLPA
ncbi:MAG: histidine kinase [Xanthomonadales bacterium]|nr:histidine kinase [Xanthomonadales bacterium]